MGSEEGGQIAAKLDQLEYESESQWQLGCTRVKGTYETFGPIELDLVLTMSYASCIPLR